MIFCKKYQVKKMESLSVETFNKFREQLYKEEIYYLRKQIADLRTEMCDRRIQDNEKKTLFLKVVMATMSATTTILLLAAFFKMIFH